jgi:molecular chaperone GrpE
MAKEMKDTSNQSDAFLDDPETIDLEQTLAETDDVSDEEQIAMLRSEVADLKDRLLRALADTENLRKRAERDRRDAELYGATRFARDLLSVHDNFHRALENVTEPARAAAPGLIEGIELTQRELLSAFAKHKILEVKPAVGDRFDPKLHQAMFEAPVPNTKAGDIIQVMGVGFTIGERLLRPAQVGVSAGGPSIPVPNGGAAPDAS